MHTYLAMWHCASERPFLPYYSALQPDKNAAMHTHTGPQRPNELCTQETTSTHTSVTSPQLHEPTGSTEPVQVCQSPAEPVPSGSHDEPLPSHLPVQTVVSEVHTQTVNSAFVPEGQMDSLKQNDCVQSELHILPNSPTLDKDPVWPEFFFSSQHKWESHLHKAKGCVVAALCAGEDQACSAWDPLPGAAAALLCFKCLSPQLAWIIHVCLYSEEVKDLPESQRTTEKERCLLCCSWTCGYFYCAMLYFWVSYFTAHILYVYFCTVRFTIWITNGKSFKMAKVPF